MSKLTTGDDGNQPSRVPDGKPLQASPPDPLKPAQSKMRAPSKTRAQAWAKIDGGKGTWKPK